MHRESNPAKGQGVRRTRGKPESGRAVVEKGTSRKATERLSGGEPESDGTVAGQGGEAAKGQVVR